jgi:hypothetical protein
MKKEQSTLWRGLSPEARAALTLRDYSSRSFAQHLSPTVQVERPAKSGRIVPHSDFFLQRGLNRLHRMYSRAGRAGQHDVGMTAYDGEVRFHDRRVRCGLAERQ